MSEQKHRHIKNNRGQSLIEFIMLLGTIILLAYILMKNINGSLAERWQLTVNLIVNPNIDNLIQFAKIP